MSLLKITNLNEFISKNKIKIILIIIFVLTITYGMINYMPYWDEAIYVSNGKYLFSAQEISTYEYQRPPLIGLLTGFFWFLGLNEILFSKVILTIIFIIGLFYLYKVSEDIKKGSGVITTIIYASLPTIVLFTNRVLTEIPGTSLSIIGYYFFTKRKYFLSGFILSLAFLFRYPTGLIFLVLAIFLFFELITNLKKERAIQIIRYVSGFSLLVIPFIIINYIFIREEYLSLPFIQKVFLPFINASKMVAANAFDLITNGYLYYIKFLFYEHFLLLFLITFILLGIIFKEMRTTFLKSKILIPFMIAILSFIYVSNLVHYEPRYFIVGLPFFAIISGITTVTLIEKIKIKSIVPILEIGLIIMLIIIYMFFIKEQILINKTTDYITINGYYTHISNIDSNYSGAIGIDNPIFGIYNEKNKIVYLSGVLYANYVITEQNNINDIKYIMFEERNYICWKENDLYCEEKLNLFNKLLEDRYYLIYKAYFYDTNHFIYKLK